MNAAWMSGCGRFCCRSQSLGLRDHAFDFFKLPPTTRSPLNGVDVASVTLTLFRRFAVMRYWHNVEHIPFEAFLDPDSLHMNDWGYDCMARLLANAIVRASTDTRETAHAPIPPG
jgi:hypothetical protein